MNTDVEELLREGMERFTYDLRAPAGIIRRAARQHCRRLMLRSAAGLAAALTAGAVALVAVQSPGAGDAGSEGPAITTAYVLGRVNRALSAAAPDIAQLQVSARGAMFAGKPATLSYVEWIYGDSGRAVTTSPAGRLIADNSVVAASSRWTATVVSYTAQTWARWVTEIPALRVPARTAPYSCQASTYPGPFAQIPWALPASRAPNPSAIHAVPSGPFLVPGTDSATVAADLRTAISCGTLTVVGRQRVDGVNAIKLRPRHSRAGLAALAQPVETVWVNARTYLPVRMTVGQQSQRWTADISWLRPTAGNLAKLTAPIPAGFRQVPVTQVVQAILTEIFGHSVRL
jgi:hypothetical protein